MSSTWTTTRTVDCGGGDSVTLRALTYGEVKTLRNSGGDDDRWLLASIVSWSGPHFDGVAISQESLDAVPAAIVARLVAVAAELNQLSDVEKNGSAAPTN